MYHRRPGSDWCGRDRRDEDRSRRVRVIVGDAGAHTLSEAIAGDGIYHIAGDGENVAGALGNPAVGEPLSLDGTESNFVVHPTTGDYFASDGQWEFFLDGAIFAASAANSAGDCS